MIRLWPIFLFILSAYTTKAQDLTYVKRLVDTLSSEEYHGRGYVNNGGQKAAAFLRTEFGKAGLEKVHFQEFQHPVNTFPGVVSLSLDGNKMVPGLDYLVQPTSGGSAKMILDLVHISSKEVSSVKRFNRFVKKVNWERCALVITDEVYAHIADPLIGQAIARNEMKSKAIVKVNEKKLTWSVRDYAHDWVELEVLSTVISKRSKTLEIELEQTLVSSFQNRNVIGQLKGTVQPDSFIVFTAHYDHLGRMGNEACFYGTNDNAGGAAMLCDLAKYYAEHPEERKYSILFIAFAGEEAGLLGSKHYVENPEVPLEDMSLLINLDLVTTGQDGMTVVNGRIFKHLLGRMRSINEEKGLMKAIKGRGKAANSDHYHFGEKGVRAIFIYLLGDYPHYHDINDTPEKPSWAGYENFFRLITAVCADQSH